MACISKHKIGNYVYLYESESFRDSNGNPRNRKKLIGKLDPSGQPVYKSDYRERMAREGKSVPPPASFTTDEIRNSSVKEFGSFYFFRNIGESSGLLETLMSSFPDTWTQIFDLACFLTATGDPMMYCDTWIEKTDAFPARLSSSEISALYLSLSHAQKEQFFETWSAYRREREYLALDITSISSYSHLIHDVEWGYNRDGEKLPQVNLCLLLGETSRLPIFQMLYSGSLKDVSTLKTSLAVLYHLGGNRLKLVMDKGFFSAKNLKTLLSGPEKSFFLLAVPFTVNKAKEAVDALRGTIDRVRHAIAWNRQSIQGVCRTLVWDGKRIKEHVYFSMVKQANDRSELFGYVARLAEMAAENPDDKRCAGEFEHYLTIRRGRAGGKVKVEVKKNVVENELRYAGWMVLISNYCTSVKEALRIYRAKDVVEKGFKRLKNDLDLNRLRVHGDDTMGSKLFVSFISLILLSYIHNVMVEKNMYRDFTLKELIHHLEKLRVQYISGERILYPLTKIQKRIFEDFNMKLPV